MTNGLNETHNPARRSWVDSANETDCDFPIQNLPFGVFSTSDRDARVGIAIGNMILDLTVLSDGGLLSGAAQRAAERACGNTLNRLIAGDEADTSALRAALSELLSAEASGNAARRIADEILVPSLGTTLLLPVRIPAFTDFCASLPHIQRSERLTNAPPRDTWMRLPVAYNGRASSVSVSGTPVRRPYGQFELPPGSGVRFAPEPLLDFELEFGAYLSRDTTLGERLTISEGASQLWGFCLLNDWSARAIQFYESALGPYLGKSFLTSVSPWVVTAEALRPFKTPTRRPDGPPIPAHLQDPADQIAGNFAVHFTADLSTERSRAAAFPDDRIVTTSFAGMSWTFSQMVAHQSSNGCPLQAGELIGSGTVSGDADDAKACLGEITEIGRKPLTLASGETRNFLEDGDEIVIQGTAQAEGFIQIGFGECVGRVIAASELK